MRRAALLYSPAPFKGMNDDGDSLPTTVTLPAEGIQSIPSRERAADRGTLRNPDRDQGWDSTGSAPRTETFTPGDAPGIKPPGIVTRVARSPLSMVTNRRVVQMNDKTDGHGQHAEFSDHVQTNTGPMNPSLQVWRNTHRLAPQPWDAGFYLDARGSR